MQLALPRFTERYLSTESTYSTVLGFKAFFLLAYFCFLFTALCHVWMSLFPEEALDGYTAGTPCARSPAPKLWFPSITPLLSSAPGPAEQASRVGSGKWRNLLFSSFLSSLQVCLAFCPQFTEKPAKKTKHLDSTRSQKRRESKTSDLLRL